MHIIAINDMYVKTSDEVLIVGYFFMKCVLVYIA